MDTIRFLQMPDDAEGDYTGERKSWLQENLHDIFREIRVMKKKQVI